MALRRFGFKKLLGKDGLPDTSKLTKICQCQVKKKIFRIIRLIRQNLCLATQKTHLCTKICLKMAKKVNSEDVEKLPNFDILPFLAPHNTGPTRPRSEFSTMVIVGLGVSPMHATNRFCDVLAS